MAPAHDGGRVSEALCDLTAIELANRYRAGEASSIDMIEAVLARTTRLNPLLNAIVTWDAVGVRAIRGSSFRCWSSDGTPSSAASAAAASPPKACFSLDYESGRGASCRGNGLGD